LCRSLRSQPHRVFLRPAAHASAQLRWRPAGQRGPAPHRLHPATPRPAYPGALRTPHPGRQGPARDHPMPQTVCRSRGLQPGQTGFLHPCVIGASVRREKVWCVSETPPNTLQYRCDGPEDAPVLILGRSLGTTWHMWDRQVPDLAQQWRVFRFDLPGHGGAPARPADSVGELATRLLATLEGLGVQRFGYAGCALGGAVGIELALRHPERLASLALIAASPRFGSADEFRRRGVIVRTNGLDPMARSAPDRWFTGGFAAAQPAITEWAVQMVRTTDPGCYIAACEALASFDVRPGLGSVGVPTLVLVGSEDQVTGPAEARN